LFAAAWKGHFEIVKYLILEQHCQKDVKDIEGQDLLIAATNGKNSELVHWLIQECGMEPIVDHVQYMWSSL
jgi:ankyrin repeat protein